MALVRAFLPADTDPVNLIMATCTRELRNVYTPKPNAEGVSQRQSHSTRIVAVDHTETVVGVAECVGRDSVLYVQGIAVAPTHRRRGVATDLLAHSTRLAADAGLQALEIATIKETGNVEVFCRLGFLVIDERVSERFLSQDSRPVTEVTLRRYVA
jgi:ribosomal protein S18 acetylase RimI-like enzyme